MCRIFKSIYPVRLLLSYTVLMANKKKFKLLKMIAIWEWLLQLLLFSVTTQAKGEGTTAAGKWICNAIVICRDCQSLASETSCALFMTRSLYLFPSTRHKVATQRVHKKFASSKQLTHYEPFLPWLWPCFSSFHTSCRQTFALTAFFCSFGQKFLILHPSLALYAYKSIDSSEVNCLFSFSNNNRSQFQMSALFWWFLKSFDVQERNAIGIHFDLGLASV